ncbi:hypothetical protein KA078_00060 [Candidatus Woesebacteria bacterium]|nr:hypothetical protein [Candidatus Woesebacteria bacterium]
MPFSKNDPNINRLGRPLKPNSWANLIQIAGEAVDPAEQKIRKLIIVERLFEMACGGDLGAIREIFDRTEGKPKQVSIFPLCEQAELDLSNPQIIKTLLLTAQVVQEKFEKETELAEVEIDN